MNRLVLEQTPMTGDGMRALGNALPLLERMIKRVAHGMTADGDERDELIQAAMVELWEMDTTRVDLSDSRALGHVREMLIEKMAKASLPCASDLTSRGNLFHPGIEQAPRQ